ncbi:histone-lysine N-methyltransferase SETMAR [Trichonephila clavipes]|nr:histone-lysine N-methyltransferase SETMAR [Trichonephila clavipes]
MRSIVVKNSRLKTIRRTDLKFSKHISFVVYRPSINKFLRNQLPAGLIQNEYVQRLKIPFGDESSCRATLYRWFNEFFSGRNSLQDEERTERPRSTVILGQESDVWVFENDPIPIILKRQRTIKKVMYAVCFRSTGLVKAIELKGQETVTVNWTATAGSDVVQSGRPIFDDFFQHLWPYICNNMANFVFQMVKRLWLIRIDQ